MVLVLHVANLSSDLYSTKGKKKQTNSALQITNVSIISLSVPLSNLKYFDTRPISTILVSYPYFMEWVWDFSITYIVFSFFQPSLYNSGYIKDSLNFPLGEAGGAIVGVEDGNFVLWLIQPKCYCLQTLTK